MKKCNLSADTNIKTVISKVLMLLFSSEKREPIEKALTLLLDFFEADWVYVARIYKEQEFVDFLYEVKSSWVHISDDDDVPRLSYRSFPWIINAILEGNDIVLSNINDLPPEAIADKELLLRQELQSMLMIPILFNGEVQGLIGFDSVKTQRVWAMHEVEDLHIIASIFSIIIEREQNKDHIQESVAHLKQSNTKFKMFFENLPLGVELYDANGYLIDLNEADAKLFGVKKEDVLGINLFDNPNTKGDIADAIFRGKDFSFPIVYRFDEINKTGYYSTGIKDEIRYLQVKGLSLNDDDVGHVGFLLIISDNTEAYLKNEQTEENLAKLKAALLNGRSVVGEYDAIHDVFTLDPILNDHMENDSLFGYLRNRFITCSQILEIIPHDEIWKDTKALFEDIIEGRKLAGTVTYCREDADQQPMWVRLNIQTYKRTPEGRLSKAICYITNVTEEMEMASKLRETEIKAHNSELEMIKALEADKLKTSFLANMSHEIRTPLNAIVGFSSIMADTENEEERRSYMNIINKNNELLLQLITDILDFSKIESGMLSYQYSDVNLKELCREIYVAHSLKTVPGVELVFKEENLPDLMLSTDCQRVTQVISNLLSNAIKFTEIGSIVLSYEVRRKDVCIFVKDTGIGIPAQRQASVFDRFIKVDEFRQGTGLGLAICKMIVEALKGKIGFISEAGVGSTFWFTLPLVEGVACESFIPSEKKDISVRPVEKSGDNKYTILIAEDIEANYHLLEVVLGKQYVLYHANNGQEAVALFKRNHPDMILMDIKMPVMDGFEATRQIRKLSKDVPIVALTAFAFEKEKQRAQEYQFNDYLVKPINIVLLRRIVREYLKDE